MITPTIAVWKAATTPLDCDLKQLIPALQHYVDDFLFPAWAVSCALAQTTGPQEGAWSLVFLDDADQAHALAYHELVAGLPVAKVFVRTLAQAGDSCSSAASHELAEMLVDPDVNRLAHYRKHEFYALEVCDPVEEAPYLSVAGFEMSNFVYPDWFCHYGEWENVPLDAGGLVTEPFSLLPGGYQSVLDMYDGWRNIFGSDEKAARFAKEDRRDHRSEWRK